MKQKTTIEAQWQEIDAVLDQEIELCHRQLWDELASLDALNMQKINALMASIPEAERVLWRDKLQAIYEKHRELEMECTLEFQSLQSQMQQVRVGQQARDKYNEVADKRGFQ